MPAGLLLAACCLDLLCGDPRWLPHPVVAIGHLISRCEEALYAGRWSKRLGGLLLVASVLGVVGLLSWLALALAGALHPWLGGLLAVWLAYTCLALRELHRQSLAVIEELEQGDLIQARAALAMIVGRETAQLDEQGILRACLETVAENSSDGIVAPLVYLGLGGPVAGLLYKAVNTMDSMVGYRNDRYREFGMVAARLDDLANWLPARLTGLLMVAASGLLGLNAGQAWRVMWRDAGKHASPNAGYPEAAAAGALGVQLGGPARYFGVAVDKPSFGEPGQLLSVAHYRKMVYLMYAVTGLTLVMMLGIAAALH